MIGWYTDNEISQGVMLAVKARGHYINHIEKFNKEVNPNHNVQIFYGILRGSGRAMQICKYYNDDFFYIDNGYFDAEYIDQHGYKNMDGKYRIVKNDMIEPYIGNAYEGEPKQGKIFLLIPPSPYTANFYDTTPEDWLQEWQRVLTSKGFIFRVRDKRSTMSLEHDISVSVGVLAFNSMSLMTALKMEVPVYDTHGMFRNAASIKQKDFVSRLHYKYADVRAFYEPKNFTLQEIAEGKSCL